MTAAVSGTALAVGLTFLAATVLQLVPAFFDPALPRTRLLPVAAFATLAAATLLTLRTAPRGRDMGWVVAGSGLAIAAAAWLAAGQPPGPVQHAVAGGALVASAIGLVTVLLGGLRVALPSARTLELSGLAAIALLFGAFAVRHVAIGGLMSWDEAVYALTARHWLEGTPITGWALHRSPGMPVLGLLSLLVAESDAAMRAWGVLFGVGLVVVTWAVARRAAGPLAGLLAAGAVATVGDLHADAARYLTDVPATALLLGLVGVILWQLDRPDGPGRGLLLASVVAALAFYVRYGASVAIVLVGLTALVAWWDRFRARPWLAVAAVALLVLLLVPHVVPAVREGGTPWAIALSARNLASPAYPGEALGTYLGIFTGRLAGPVAAALAWLAVIGWGVSLVDLAVRRRIRRGTRVLTLLVVPALVQGLLLGVVALPQTRYVFFPIVLLVLAGAIVLVAAASAIGRRLRIESDRRLVAALGGLAVVGLLVAAAWGGVPRVGSAARASVSQLDVLDIAAAIRDDADGRSCAVLTYFVPDVTWYSGCAGYNFGVPPRTGRESLLTEQRRYLLLFTGDAGGLQPSGDARAYYVGLADGPPIATVSDRGSGKPAAEIYRLR